MSELVSETRHYRGIVIDHSEVFAANGLLPVPDVGGIYHVSARGGTWNKLMAKLGNPRSLPATSSISISRDHSFRLVGTCEIEDENALRADVENATKALVAFRSASEAVYLQAVRVAQARGADDSAQERSATTLLRAAEDDLREARETLDSALIRPGLVVARWSAEGESTSSGGFGSTARASKEHRASSSGFVVLGGIRVIQLYVGDDFKQMVARLGDSDQAAIRFAALATHVLQARHVAYVADSEVLQMLAAQIEIDMRKLGSAAGRALVLDTLTLDYYSRSLEEAANTGVLPPIRWLRRPYCFVTGDDLAGVGAVLLDQDIPGSATYHTVSAQFAHPGAMVERFGEVYRREYDEMRLPGPGRLRCEPNSCDAFPELGKPGGR